LSHYAARNHANLTLRLCAKYWVIAVDSQDGGDLVAESAANNRFL
jgi:hypothetical protein